VAKAAGLKPSEDVKMFPIAIFSSIQSDYPIRIVIPSSGEVTNPARGGSFRRLTQSSASEALSTSCR